MTDNKTQVDFIVDGMTCASCVGRVERTLKKFPEVVSANVNLASGRANVELSGSACDLGPYLDALNAAGYPARQAIDHKAESRRRAQAQAEEMRTLKRSFVVAAVLTLPVFLLEMGSHLIPGVAHWVHTSIGQQNSWILQFLLTSGVMFGPGRRFFRLGVPALLRLSPDMNSLVAMGTTAAWSYSTVVLFLPGVIPEGSANVYFEAAAVIVTLILMGRYLETRARGRTGEAIARLVGLQPDTARVETPEGIRELPLGEIAVGTRVQVLPGERIALDGQVLTGQSYVDESMLSGEPIPVHKQAGDTVTGGTINTTGAFTFEVRRVGDDTVLARIIQMVDAAQGSKLPIQSVVDRVTLWFVPAVMLVAAITFIAWMWLVPDGSLSMALINAVSVLIVACPCAMGLATPVSIMVATGRSAEMGILFRNGQALQALSDTRIVAFDKTGTLTEGTPALTDILLLSGEGGDDATLLSLVAALEIRSEHPIATAIVAAAQQRALVLPEVTEFEAVPGHGLRGVVGGQQIQIGAQRLLTPEMPGYGEALLQGERLAKEGKTPVYVLMEGGIAALLAVADRPRETSAGALAALKKAGCTTVMITGDSATTAAAIAATLGIDRIFAERLPETKVQALHELRAQGDTLAYVGDGINDAPALAEADVGIAMGSGTDVAIESADLVLMSGDLTGVVDAVAIARATMRNIHQNLFWAFIYNIALIPLATGAFYPAFGVLLSPVFAAGAMAMSSVFVIGNALRLRRFQGASRLV
ncbi:MAG: copper-translocating P-type ATPase [Pseudomonadales bacterium]|nr:copper-translocating P-type ATPase [Pseudomonadales bacterium]MCP5357279.1 copper-translocating P-type ATPase [Pseudomonadales bacterium]